MLQESSALPNILAATSMAGVAVTKCCSLVARRDCRAKRVPWHDQARVRLREAHSGVPRGERGPGGAAGGRRAGQLAAGRALKNFLTAT